jgi:hypothetical protein
MIIFSAVICLFGGNVAASECPFDISCQGPWVASESEGGTAPCQWWNVTSLPELLGAGQRLEKWHVIDARIGQRCRQFVMIALALLHSAMLRRYTAKSRRMPN